jgi:hypothetical protein
MEKKTKEKGVYKFLNQFTVIYISFQILQQKSTSIQKCIRCKLILHKEKGTQNLLSIYENLQFPKFTTKNVHASQIDQSRRMSSKERETSDKCMGKKFQEWVLIQKFHNCSSDV